MTQPTIISYDPGYHGSDLAATRQRLDAEAQWKDLSCIILTPAGPSVPTRVVAAWQNLIRPPNNRVTHMFAQGVEVGEAYSNMIANILAHPELSGWKYILTLEHDNAPPPDGLVALLRRMEHHPEFAVIGGLYFTKGPAGVAQIWGDPRDPQQNARPQLPDLHGGLVECCGTGMGFTMFRLEMFKDARLRRPWFKTPASREEGVATQDLYFAADARKHGYRFAVDCGVKVGHWSQAEEIMW